MALYQMVLHLVKLSFAVPSIRRFYNYPEKLSEASPIPDPLLCDKNLGTLSIYLSPRLGSIVDCE